MLLVHGQPGAGEDWAGLAALLVGRHRVLAPDRPGWGNHPRPATTLAGNAAALERMLATLQIEGPVTVVGHSLGGGVAIELALTRPDLVRALVLAGSVGVEGALSGMDRVLAVPIIGDSILRAGVAAVRRGVATGARLSRVKQAAPLVERANRHPGVRAVMSEGMKPMTDRQRRSFLVEQRALIDETPSIERRLSLLAVPTVVVHGTSDHIVPLGAARILASAIAGAELSLAEGQGHMMPFERPEVIAALVQRYSALAERSR